MSVIFVVCLVCFFISMYTENMQKSKKYVGASVLCFSRTPDNLLYFMLGREIYKPHYRDSCKYSDFGGGTKKLETAYECASREFMEETLNAVPIFLQENHHTPSVPMRDSKHMSRMLQKHVYHAKVDFVFNNNNHTCVYTTFVVQVPWMPEVSDRFLFLTNLYKPCEKDRIDYLSPEMILREPTTIQSNMFPTLQIRPFFKKRFRNMFQKCFPKDHAFLCKHQTHVPHRSIRVDTDPKKQTPLRSIYSHGPKTSDSNKNTWQRAQNIHTTLPRTPAFNHGLGNYRIGKKCRGARVAGHTGRRDHRWERGDEEGKGKLQAGVAASSPHP